MKVELSEAELAQAVYLYAIERGIMPSDISLRVTLSADEDTGITATIETDARNEN